MLATPKPAIAESTPATVSSTSSAMTLQCAANLLDRLASDDAFRDLFKHSPREALSAAGMPVPEGSITPLCTMVQQLASKEEIEHSRQALLEYLSGAGRTAMNVVFTFESRQMQRVISTR